MTLTLTQGHNGSAEDKNQRWMTSTSKQAVKIKLVAMVGHEKFYFSQNSSVAFMIHLELWSHEHLM